MNLPRIALLVLLFAGLTVLVGCDSADTETDSGSLRVLLTDAPGDFLAAVVTIEQVYLQAESGDDDPESGRLVLSDDTETVDLLTLQNDVLALVDGETVPAGSYAQLRLVISGGYIEVEDEDGGSTVYASSDAYADAQGVSADGRLQMPSYATSGLKIDLPADLAQIDSEEQIVLIDFDVAESFGQQAGNSGMWVMRPVVRATDFTLTGSGAVTLALADGVELPSDTLSLANFSAALDKDGELITVPFADADGDEVYTVDFRYLVPGTYPVDLVAPDGVTVETDLALPFDLTVDSDTTTRGDVVITSATGD